ncbi:CDP-glycerol glycerophosphotransferase family protein [Methanobrevibacter filiformis]|uniref:CDP-glycerol:poly(Glycerophosphate) glycerophosphotransferase n=1 Tax=Methanobrevibacter filiformis TaxID=55758 RepID=A0A166F3W1_9EURY|nr:CDP-glycerol glycerophosphotransferase family protein [Methanobrevibacter filiformis]KZX17289.1 CDP-glycerol:poly(glycerophosphate) glycerophosphotransferase [Methanobrevibacter filiformis]
MSELKKILLVPTAYNKRALEDIERYISVYKHKFEINVLLNELDSLTIEKDGYNLVKNGTSYGRYLKHTSDYVIDAGSMNSGFKGSSKTKWVSVWHGIPYKKMFADFDEKSLNDGIKYSEAYDIMISMSPYYSETFLRNAMLYFGEIKELGSAKIDKLFANEGKTLNIKYELGIPLDKKIILYAPTYREKGKFSLPFDPMKLIESLPNSEEFILIIKLHYLSWLDQNTFNCNIVDYTNYPEVLDLMLISDILISDYSSLILDYSVLNKPIILFQHDKEEYLKNMGTYFDFEDFIPKKQIVQTEKELYNLVGGELENDNSKLREFFYPYENGNSTEKIVKALDFDDSPRRFKEIIFLINELNQIGGVHSFVTNMAKYYKNAYNSKIFVIAIKEFAYDKNFIKLFESEYVDFTWSSQTNPGMCKTILRNTNGYVISMQFNAHSHFQKFLKDKNSILMVHGDVKEFISNNISTWCLNSLNSYELHSYKKLIVLSKKQENLLKPHLNDNIQKKLTNINNSVELNHTPSEQASKNNFAYIGRLSKDKNSMDLINIGKEIKRENLDFKINIYGTGELSGKIEKEIKYNNLENILFLRGYEENKGKIFKNNCALISVSETGGFGSVILEAYSFGRSVILFNSFTITLDLVEDNKTGFLVDLYDYPSFIEKMKKINGIKEEDIKKQIEKFDNEKIFKEWNNIFSQIEDEEGINPKNKIKTSKNKKSNLKSKTKGKTKITKTHSKRNNNRRQKTINYLNKKLPKLTKKLKSSIYELQGKKPIVSVIIPCYNSTATIKDAVQSVLRQKLKDIEIVVVDDGSKNRVKDIIDGFNSFKIKYYYKEHSGLGLTRNCGIENANGEYLFFLDSDDKITKNSLNDLVTFAKDKNLNVVSGITKRHNMITNDETLWLPSIYNEKRIDNIKSRLSLYKDTLSTNKLYRKDYLVENNLLFENVLYEDKLFTTKLYTRTENIGILDQIVYIWNVRENNSSITTSLTPENFKERIKSIVMLWDHLPEYKKPDIFAFFVNHDMILYVRKFKFFTAKEKKEVFELIQGFCNKYGNYLYPKLVNKTRLRIIYCAMENDYESFLKIVNTISNDFRK